MTTATANRIGIPVILQEYGTAEKPLTSAVFWMSKDTPSEEVIKVFNAEAARWMNPSGADDWADYATVTLWMVQVQAEEMTQAESEGWGDTLLEDRIEDGKAVKVASTTFSYNML